MGDSSQKNCSDLDHFIFQLRMRNFIRRISDVKGLQAALDELQTAAKKCRESQNKIAGQVLDNLQLASEKTKVVEIAHGKAYAEELDTKPDVTAKMVSEFQAAAGVAALVEDLRKYVTPLETAAAAAADTNLAKRKEVVG